jgi:hypothetical protein
MNGRAVVTEYAWATSSCDPCPTPPLGPNDLATLGLDVLDPAGAQQSAPVGGPGRPRPRPMVGGLSRFAYGMTVTRLHTRYDARTLGEDLVFREVGAVVGGREHVIDPQTGALEQGAQPAQYGGNNFQARYAIRHPWTGPIRCQNPRRGIWGGPPSGSPSQPTRPALDLASRTGAAIELPRVVRSAVPELGIRGGVAGARPGTRSAHSPGGAGRDAGATGASEPRRPVRVQPKGGDSRAPLAVGSAMALAALAWAARRRRP